MAGCFGSSPYDRAMEQQLMRHLDEEDQWYCEECGEMERTDDLDIIEGENNNEFWQCKNCKNLNAF